MSKATIDHVELLRLPGDAPIPSVSANDLFRYLPLLAKLLDAFNTGTGTFSTWTPKGKRWIAVLDKDPALS